MSFKFFFFLIPTVYKGDRYYRVKAGRILTYEKKERTLKFLGC